MSSSRVLAVVIALSTLAPAVSKAHSEDPADIAQETEANAEEEEYKNGFIFGSSRSRRRWNM